jgi:uncharacterized protein YodC (DUF2158 family)
MQRIGPNVNWLIVILCVIHHSMRAPRGRDCSVGRFASEAGDGVASRRTATGDGGLTIKINFNQSVFAVPTCIRRRDAYRAEFKMRIGDIVFIAGGPKMTVRSIGKASFGRQPISCVWFNKNQVAKGIFEAAVLRQAAPEENAEHQRFG